MKVAQLYTYPVKSLAGFSLDTAELTFSGFQFDRQWMVVKPDGMFMTQRTHPQMALVNTHLDDNKLILSSFGMEDLAVDKIDENGDNRLTTDVWGSGINGLVHNQTTNEWLSDAIGEECKLLSFPKAEKRQCDLKYASEGDHTLFADGFPLLVVSQESLDDLNSRLSSAVGMDRFRPNIVVQGCDPFAEDDWKNIEVNPENNNDQSSGIVLRSVKACERCSVPTVHPKTGALAGPEPIHTLSSYRRKEDGEVYFGMSMVPESGGLIGVGDSVSVLN